MAAAPFMIKYKQKGKRPQDVSPSYKFKLVRSSKMMTVSIAKVCSIENCEKLAHARGWCQGHYKKWTKYGDPREYRLLRDNDAARFWAFVDKTPNLGPDGDCWEWRGCGHDQGYGQIWIDGKMIMATHYAFFLEHGRYPDPLVRHTCDNPPCVKSNHLLEGTQLDNMRDKMARGRHRNQYGPC